MSSGRSTTAGTASMARRTSGSSPAPNTWEWLASTCSTRVVPERGMPKTKTGRGVSSPAPARRLEQLRREGGDQPIDVARVFVGVVGLAAAAAQLAGQGVGRLQAGGGLGVVAAGVGDMGEGKEQVHPQQRAVRPVQLETEPVAVGLRQPAARSTARRASGSGERGWRSSASR